MKAIPVVAYGVLLSGLAVSPAAGGPALAGTEFLLTSDLVLLDGEFVAEFDALTLGGWLGNPFTPSPAGNPADITYLETPLGPGFGLITLYGTMTILFPRSSFPGLTLAVAYVWFDGTKWHMAGIGIAGLALPALPFPIGFLSYSFQGSQIVPPPNDHFANRIVLNGIPASATGTTAGSSVEFGEPLHAFGPFSDSVWWSWTAPQSTRVDIQATGGHLAVYTGPGLGFLARIPNPSPRLRFEVLAGTSYQIAVFNSLQRNRDVELQISFSPPAPVNDLFADRIALSGLPAMDSGTTVGANAEAGEPAHEGSFPAMASVWWSWTAPNTGCVELDTSGSDISTVLAIYTGSSLDTLSLAATSQGLVRINAEAGKTYQIAVDGWFGSEGAVALNIVDCQPAAP